MLRKFVESHGVPWEKKNLPLELAAWNVAKGDEPAFYLPPDKTFVLQIRAGEIIPCNSRVRAPIYPYLGPYLGPYLSPLEIIPCNSRVRTPIYLSTSYLGPYLDPCLGPYRRPYLAPI